MYSVLDCFIPSCGRWWKWVTLDHPSVRWCSQLHLISSLAVPGVSKSWSGVKESVACVAGGIIVPGILSWQRTCHSKRVKGENPSLTCSQSSRGSAAKRAQHLPLNRQLRRLRRVWVFFPFFAPIPSLSSPHKSPLYQSSAPCKVIILEYEQSLVFLSLSSKRARHANDHAGDWRHETGEARFSPLLLRLSRACTRLTKSEGKERLLAVFNHPESGKFLLLESGVLSFRIPNLGLIKLRNSATWNLKSTA